MEDEAQQSTSEDVEIRLGGVSTPDISEVRSPLQDPDFAVEAYGQPVDSGLLVFLKESVFRALETHVCREVDRETGGVLLGEACRSGSDVFVLVTDFIHASEAQGSRSHLTFTHEAWQSMLAEKENRSSGLSIVGWYHTHPGMGVFLSGEDTFIQKNFFRERWQIALVIDPIRQSRGVFRWHNSQVEQMDGFYIYSASRHQKELRQYVHQIQRQAKRKAISSTTRDCHVESDSPAKARLADLIIILLLCVVLVESLFLFAILRKPAEFGVEGYLRLGNVFWSAGEYQQAVAFYRVARYASPEDIRPHKELLRTLAELQDFQALRDAQKQAHQLAEKLDRKGDKSQASELRTALQLSGSSQPPLPTTMPGMGPYSQGADAHERDGSGQGRGLKQWIRDMFTGSSVEGE